MPFDKEKARQKFLEENKPLPPPINRAEQVADIVAENASFMRIEPISKIVARVGYPQSTVLQPSRVTSTEKFKARLELNAQKHAKIMSKRRLEALKLMYEKQGEAKYRDLVYGVDIMTKNERLITGQATENIGMQGSLVMIPSKDSEFKEPEADNTA